MRTILWTAVLLLGCNPEPPPNVPPSPSSSDSSLVATDAAPNKPSGTSLWIDDKLVECEGDHPMKCMRARSKKDGEWELLYAPIEGFTFEEGNAYELRVDMTDPKKLRLVEIVSKTKTKTN